MNGGICRFALRLVGCLDEATLPSEAQDEPSVTYAICVGGKIAISTFRA